MRFKEKLKKLMVSNKILNLKEIQSFRETHSNQKIVFTNGCFDILHVGHIDYLRKAADMGDLLVVGLNSDESVRKLKGASRPINNQNDRAEVLSALSFVDYIAIFDEDTPLDLIKIFQPDVLVKGADYKPEEVVGREEVEDLGGKLVLIPFSKGKSTTNTVRELKKLQDELIKNRLKESIIVKQQLLNNSECLKSISLLADEIRTCLKNSGKLILCSNGGSASDALHFAGEVVGRYQRERRAFPAVVLNADVATMTALSNDYGYSEVFAKQAEAHVSKNDVFIGISTSGNSENVLRAVEVAKRKGAVASALLGRDGGKIARKVDYPIIIPCDVTARVQETHICIIHILCELIETPLVMLADE